MRRRSTSPAMSLFPFLDTLVCTMGALILMLLAMTPKIKERAQARVQAQLAALAPTQRDEPQPEFEPEPAPEPEPALEPVAIAAAPDRAQVEEDRAAERKRRREAWFKTAEEAREMLAVKQVDYRNRRQLLKESDQRLKDIQDRILKSRLKSEALGEADQSLAEMAARLEEQEELIAQEIAKTRKSIDLVDRRQAAAKNEYALVPYDGTSGTVRRPIYIECTGKGFRFLPEDETVSPADLAGFAENYNPLLMGTQSLVRFWARRRRNSPESEPEPYVLLLVRPSGCLTYYLARKCLSSLSVNFGYELIEEDWKLSVPDPDLIAKSLLKDTLDTTVQTRRPSINAFAEAVRGSRDSFDGHEFARSQRSNHFGPADDDDNWGEFGSGSGNGSGSGRGTGRKPAVTMGPATRASRNAAGIAADDDPLEGVAGGTATRTGAGTGTGIGTGAGAKTAAGGGAGSGRGRGSARAAGMNGTLSPDDQTGGTGLSSGPGVNGGKRGSSKTGSPFGGAGRGGGQGFGGSSRPATLGGSPSEFGGDGASDDGDQPGEPMPPDKLFGDEGPRGTGGSGFDPSLRPRSPNSSRSTGQSPVDSSGGDSSDGNSSAGDGASSGSSRPDSRSGSRPGSQSGSRSGTPSGSPSSSDTASSSSGAPVSDGQGSAGSSSSQGDPATASSSAGGSAASVQMGGPGATFRLGGGKKAKPSPKDDDPDSGPRIPENDAKSGAGSYRSRGPRKWGQVGKKASTGWERKIEIRLLSDRILVGSKDVAIPVKRADSDEEIVGRVVNAIDYVADKWGEPREGYYWVPAVRFVVYPGGNQYSEKLSKVLEQKYGVNSTIDFAEDKAVKKTAPRGRP